MLLTPSLPKRREDRAKRPRKVARHGLRDRLVEMITTGKFSPGEKLVQLGLSKKFGVSMSLIREALLDLQALGLVETSDNRGFFVRQFDAKTLLDIYDVREALEGMAARLASERITPDQIAELRQLVVELCEAAKSGKHEHRAELDRLFHDRINQIADNQTIIALTRQCGLFGKFIYTDAGVEHLRRVHTVLLDAISEKQPAEAERLARVHVQEGRVRIVAALERGGEGIYWLVSPITK